MQQVSSPVFNQNGWSQKKKSEGERGNPQRRRMRKMKRRRPCQRPVVEVEEEEDLKQ